MVQVLQTVACSQIACTCLASHCQAAVYVCFVCVCDTIVCVILLLSNCPQHVQVTCCAALYEASVCGPLPNLQLLTGMGGRRCECGAGGRGAAAPAAERCTCGMLVACGVVSRGSVSVGLSFLFCTGCLSLQCCQWLCPTVGLLCLGLL